MSPSCQLFGADASPFDKYVKKKKLEPLETYVPAVLLTQDQFRDLEKSLEFEKPRYDESRSLLRSGPASSLRINIRAVAQYASSSGQGKAASDAVDECLRALEDLDSLLLQASRNNPSASVDVMRSKISVALGALDNLLQTVPSAVLDKGKAIADAYRTPADDYEVDNSAELVCLDSKLASGGGGGAGACWATAGNGEEHHGDQHKAAYVCASKQRRARVGRPATRERREAAAGRAAVAT
ncbi:hypothetical protein E2562_019406 [Oryza meyeriana var. granulata]|uniref:DUF7880 domain-containing protein n=1 Tax=Oryza meyeriana var. granulata TaxID=110450 RepID=A0A6G1DK68_9ORYZ|nr:hypothetical protein E2562_019406 [Oryza meyeriana var. granulata]